jgi:hypothetical protein
MQDIVGLDIVCHIGSFLDVESLCNLESTCKAFRTSIKTSVVLWQAQCANLDIHLVDSPNWNAPFLSILRYCAIRKYCARRLLRCMVETPERGIGRFALNMFPMAEHYREWNDYMKSAGISSGRELFYYMERVFPYSVYCAPRISAVQTDVYDRRQIFVEILRASGYVLPGDMLSVDGWTGYFSYSANDRLAIVSQLFALLKHRMRYKGSNRHLTWMMIIVRKDIVNDLAHCKGKSLPESMLYLPIEPKPYSMESEVVSSMIITRNYPSTYLHMRLPETIVDGIITNSQYPFSIAEGRAPWSIEFGGLVPYTEATWNGKHHQLKIGYDTPITPLCVADHYLIVKQCLEHAVSKGATIVSEDQFLVMIRYAGVKTIAVVPREDVFVFKRKPQSQVTTTTTS